MIHAPSFGSAMKRATCFTACCTSTRLIDMQLARIVALLNVDAESLSSFVSICGGPLLHLHRWSCWHRPDSSVQARLLDGADLLRFLSCCHEIQERHAQVTHRFRIVAVLSSPSSGPRIPRHLRITCSLSLGSAHANCIESPVKMKSSPCTNPHSSHNTR